LTLERLFEPLELGSTTLACRIVSSSHQTMLTRRQLVTEELIAYHEARARGGVGLIILEAAAIEPGGVVTDATMAGYAPETVEGWHKLGAMAHRYGTRMFVQLAHGGRESFTDGPRPVVASSAAVPSLRYHTEPRALTTGEVEGLIEAFATCAATAASAELDGIELSASHGYLLEQFFTPGLNNRSDRFAEPARFLIEAIEAVRANAGDLTVGVRFTAASAAAPAIAREVAGSVDFLHTTTGDSSTFDGCIDIVPLAPTPLNVIAAQSGPFRGLGPPLIATGRIIDPVDADAIIGRGDADAVGMNRALITDPDLAMKARTGALHSVVRCIGCNVCIEHYHAHSPIACAQNPRTGRELTLPRPEAASRRVTVAVVGGGPAGLAAAAEAAAAGHEVVLFEASQQLGGQVLLAGRGPGHAELCESLLRNYRHLLDHPNVQIELGVRADVDVVRDAACDAVIVATGARPYVPPFELEDVSLLSAWEVLRGARPTGRVVIADWGGDAVALDCAEALARDGVEVTLATGALTAGETLHQYLRNAYLGRLHRAGVRLVHHEELTGACAGRILFRNVFAPDLSSKLEADVLIYSLGRVPDDELTLSLEASGITCRPAGDCLSPRGIEEAVLEGTLAARELVITSVKAPA
jgi:2,4-dienoyl-CoA reductase-like NADH-dependent reductase (Old Yellow Enzyme family)/thioredoxin reductase